MSAFYNEIKPYAASWLECLAKEGHIANGQVCADSITDLRPADVRGATQFHAFAGLGGWSYALRLAGWTDDEPVWTGSCPCQPFSGAGRKGGFDDARHLWPAWFDLIRECRPPIVFGEQVASPDGLAWLDAVSADLEGAGYAVGAADLCAAGVGAPHIRQRLYFVAYPSRRTCREDGSALSGASKQQLTREAGERRSRGLGRGSSSTRSRGETNGWLSEPNVCRVADGLPANVEQLRAYGNAIVPQVAATFIQSVMEIL